MECYTLTEQNIFFFSIVLASDMKPGVEVRPMEYWGNILNAAPLLHAVLLSLAFSSAHSFFFRTVFLLLGLTHGSPNQGQAW